MNRYILGLLGLVVWVGMSGCGSGYMRLGPYQQTISIQNNTDGFVLRNLTVSGRPMALLRVNRTGPNVSVVRGELLTGEEAIVGVDAWAGSTVQLKVSVFDPSKTENGGYVGLARRSIYVDSPYRGGYRHGYQVDSPEPWIINVHDVEWASKPK